MNIEKIIFTQENLQISSKLNMIEYKEKEPIFQKSKKDKYF